MVSLLSSKQQHLKVVTYNIFATPFNNNEDRYKLQAEQLKQLDADVICLQECYSYEVQQLYMDSTLKDHYDFYTTHTTASFKPLLIISALNFKISLFVLYLFARLFVDPNVLELDAIRLLLIALLVSVTKDIGVVKRGAQLQNIASKQASGSTTSSTNTSSTTSSSTVSAVNSHSILYFILSLCNLPRIRDLLEGDTLGLMTLVKRDSSKLRVKPESIVRHVYDYQAFKLSWTSIFEWCFKPKGYLSLEVELLNEGTKTAAATATTMVLIVNTHLSIGLNNTRRIHQVRELKREVFKKSHGGRITAVLCGDKNADHAEPEMHYLRSRGFIDSYLQYYGGNLNLAPKNGATWDNENPLTMGFLVEPNQRLDYVFVKPALTSTGSQQSDVQIENSQLCMNEAPFLSDHFGVMTTMNIGSCC